MDLESVEGASGTGPRACADHAISSALPRCSPAVVVVPMLEEALTNGGPQDSGSLRVAATWLWTRFDQISNSELVGLLNRGGLAPADSTDLKQVDRAIQVACRTMFFELLDWALVAGERYRAMAPTYRKESIDFSDSTMFAFQH